MAEQLALGSGSRRVSLAKASIPIVTEIDTRALVRHLRTRGVMRGVLSAIGARSAKAGRKSQEHSQHGRTRSGQPCFHARGL